MREIEIEGKKNFERNVVDPKLTQERRDIELWFRTEYLFRLEHVRRCAYLGVMPDETEYEVQKEAYDKEQRLREIAGKPLLQQIKVIDLVTGGTI